MRRLFISLAVLLFIITAAVADEPKRSDWPAFRGADGSGVSPDRGLPERWTERDGIVWKTELPGPGSSSPIILGDRIFLSCYTGFGVPGQRGGSPDDLRLMAVCLDRTTGKIQWNESIQSASGEQANIREGHGYASGTPVADNERVYFAFGKSGAFAYSHEGKQLWRQDLGDGIHGWGSAVSPVVVDNLVVFNASVECESLIALDKKTGKEVWRVRGIKESWNTPLLATSADGRKELVIAYLGKVIGLDPKTGNELWSCATEIGWYMVPSLVANDGVAYCVGGRSGGGLAIRLGGAGDVTRTHRIWTIKKGSNVTSPIFYEGHLYWMNDNNGIAYCANAKTGKILYEERVERADQVYGSAVLGDGKLYYPSRSGRMFVVAARPEYHLIATNSLGDRSMFNATPALAGSRLYVRSDRFLYCIGK